MELQSRQFVIRLILINRIVEFFVLIEVNCKTNHMLSDKRNIFYCILMMTIHIAGDMSSDGCKSCTRDISIRKSCEYFLRNKLTSCLICMSIYLFIFKNSLRFSFISTSLRCCFPNDATSYDRTDFASLTLFMNK